jgi:DNA-binding CsgD family transcriptional regulator
MIKETVQIETITEAIFFDDWTSKRTQMPEGDETVVQFFKPYIETIPKLVLGEYYWQIFDNALPSPKIMMIGGSVEKLTPTDAEGLMSMSIEAFFAFFHPDDLKQIFTFVKKLFDILFNTGLDIEKRNNFNGTIYARIRNHEGAYIWNSLQYPALYFDEKGSFLYGMSLYTNVHHLMKPDAVPMMTLLDATDKENQIFTCYTPMNEIGTPQPYPSVSKREKEILTLLGQGKASKQIGAILGITKNTVDNHRQRLLKKFGVTSSAELVIKALIA